MALHPFPRCETITIAWANWALSLDAYYNTIYLYYKNLYESGNKCYTNPEVVKGVYTVESPITPIFIYVKLSSMYGDLSFI